MRMPARIQTRARRCPEHGRCRMGNIKPTYIKRVAIDLVTRFPDEFNHDYEHNKQKVLQLTDITTNHMRNKVAGYITSLKGRSDEN